MEKDKRNLWISSERPEKKNIPTEKDRLVKDQGGKLKRKQLRHTDQEWGADKYSLGIRSKKRLKKKGGSQRKSLSRVRSANKRKAATKKPDKEKLEI